MNKIFGVRSVSLLSFVLALDASSAFGQPPGEGPVLETHLDQQDIENGTVNLIQVRRHGRVVFSTPFNKLDGYGDGPLNPNDTTSPGGRPTLQDNGTLLRVNGLDAQSCLECHSILSNADVPFRFGVGGVGGSSANALAGPTVIDVANDSVEGFAFFNGRFINPPFLFGSGGVELLAKEMTVELQSLKTHAEQNPGVVVPLVTKGVDFGEIVFVDGKLDTSAVEGIDSDLVVRPFGRKGEFATVRDFDLTALQFHMGMQPVEVVGVGNDADGDGVADEVLPGDISALHIFNTNLERPEQRGNSPDIRRGEALFEDIGCDRCHRPELTTDTRHLTYSFPEVHGDPGANVFYEVDQSKNHTKFESIPHGGLRVRLFADLKRHDMGPALAESTGGALDAEFTTARLWGVADTAPYLHDGRAQTLTDAILLHGGEAEPEQLAFAALDDIDRVALLAFLRSLRTPQRLALD